LDSGASAFHSDGMRRKPRPAKTSRPSPVLRRPRPHGLDALDEGVDEMLANAFRREAPARLAHYTRDVGTVAKILGTRIMRATECKHASGGTTDLDVATEMIKNLFSWYESRGIASPYRLAYSCGVVRSNYTKWRVSPTSRSTWCVLHLTQTILQSGRANSV